MQVSQKELLNAKFNLMSTHDLLLEEKEYEKIQEYVIAREMIRDRAVANCEQNCFTENDNSRF